MNGDWQAIAEEAVRELRNHCVMCGAACGDDAPRGYVKRCEEHAALYAAFERMAER